MHIKSVEFARVLSDGNYGSTRAAVVVEIEPGEAVEEAWEMARAQCAAQLGAPLAPAPPPAPDLNDPQQWYATEPPDDDPPASDPAWDALAPAPRPETRPEPARGDLTERQQKAIYAIARTEGVDPDTLAQELYGRPVSRLSKTEASTLIDRLKAGGPAS